MTTITARKFSLKEYHKLIEIGLLKEEENLELIQGEILEMAAKGTFHVVCCANLYQELVIQIRNLAIVRSQEPVSLLSKSEPEPDLVILKNKEDKYLSGHPTEKDIILIIEIADSSLKYDQEVKLPLYGEAGINNYWLFNLKDQQLESYSIPYQKRNGDYGYSKLEIYLSNQEIYLPDFNDLKLELVKIFP